MRGETEAKAGRIWLKPFQSTPLMREETLAGFRHSRIVPYFNPLPSCEGRRRRNPHRLQEDNFNPLPSCEGRPAPAHAAPAAEHISIHSPHARGDDEADHLYGWDVKFQSTPLVRGETLLRRFRRVQVKISIHSPRARGDARPTRRRGRPPRISIHSPHARGDWRRSAEHDDPAQFQSTPLVRGETVYCVYDRQDIAISIHSPHARGDGSCA